MVSSSISPLSYNLTVTSSEFIKRVCTRLFSLDLNRSCVFVFGFIVRSFLSSGRTGSASTFFTVSVFGLTKIVLLVVLAGLFLFGLVTGGFVVVFVVELLAGGLVFTSAGLLFTGEFFFLKNGST